MTYMTSDNSMRVFGACEPAVGVWENQKYGVPNMALSKSFFCLLRGNGTSVDTDTDTGGGSAALILPFVPGADPGF